MAMDYVHESSPYGRFDSFTAFARYMHLLRDEQPPQIVVSDNMAAASAAAATAAQSSAAATALAARSGAVGCTEWSSSALFCGLLLLLALLHTALFLAQKLFAFRARQLAARRDKATPGGVMQWFSFLSPNASSSPQVRAPTYFGFALGCACILTVQWLMSPAVTASMWGTRSAAELSAASTAAANAASSSSPSSALTAIGSLSAIPASCPPCPACPAAPICPPPPICPAPRACPACYRLTDMPALVAPLFQQDHWGGGSVTVHAPACTSFVSGGRWVPRTGGGFVPEDKKTWPPYTRVEQFMQFGGEPIPENLMHVFEPPAECGSGDASTFQRFDAEKFLRAFSGKTISFLGDSLTRQQFGQLCAQLDEYKLGTSWFYPPHARFLDAVREVHFAHNVTLKNQWIMGHNQVNAARDETFPTIWRSDLLILNFGAFFQNGEEWRGKFAESLQRALVWIKNNYKGAVIWREYSPTHFDTRTSEFEDLSSSAQKPECKNYDPSDASLTAADHTAHYTNYRLVDANRIVAEANIPIMRVWNHSLVQPNAKMQHPGHGDCRHWISKSSILEHWTDVLYNMIMPQQ